MKKILCSKLSALLIMGLLTFSTGCNKNQPTNPLVIKALLQTAVITFQAAMMETSPGWDSAKFSADALNIINQWQVGTSWKQNVLNLLPTLIADAKDVIPHCADKAKCTALVNIFAMGAQSVIADLQGLPVQTSQYRSWEEYRQDWNRAAPLDAQLPSEQTIVAGL